MAMVRWTPVRDLEDMFGAMFDRSLSRLSSGDTLLSQRIVPAMDVVTHGDDLEIRLEIPGLDPEKDLDVSIEDNILFISGERHLSREENEESYVVREMASGSFVRSFPLPEGVDENQIRAEYTDGVLMIQVPKGALASEKQRKHIEIGGEGQAQGQVQAQGEGQAQAQHQQPDLEQAADETQSSDEQHGG